MAKLEWDLPEGRFYETGVNNCALYVQTDEGKYGEGVAWDGITAITESPSGAESTPLYADDIKYLNLISNEDFGATIEAYTYPKEFEQCDGTANLVEGFDGVTIGQQGRRTFGLAYKTRVGNASKGTDYGYKIHLIYGATAAPSEKAHSTINESPEAITFSWELSTIPVNVTGGKPTAVLTIDTTKFTSENKSKLKQLEDKLFGSETETPTLLLPDEIAELLK